MKVVKTFTATIWLGLRGRYSHHYFDSSNVNKIVDEFNNTFNYGITVTPTQFRYVNGWEPGVAIGFIQYPRFPIEEVTIKHRALELARRLKVALNQERVSVVFPTETIMIENEDNETNFLDNETKI